MVKHSRKQKKNVDHVLVQVTHCPACNSQKREIINHPFKETKYSGYLRSLGAPLDAARLIRCLECQSVYRDPWFTATAMKPVYEGEWKNHNAGLETLQRPSLCALEEHGRKG